MSLRPPQRRQRSRHLPTVMNLVPAELRLADKRRGTRYLERWRAIPARNSLAGLFQLMKNAGIATGSNDRIMSADFSNRCCAFDIYLLLAAGACQLVLERLDQKRDHRARVRLHERLDRHARHHLDVAEPCELLIRHADPDRVVALAALGILAHVGRNSAHGAVDLRRRALAEGYESQDGGLPDAQLIDLLRRHLRLDL